MLPPAQILLFALVLAGPKGRRAPFAPPRLQVEPAGRVDLGSLGPREVRTQAYVFSNLSGAPLRLRLYDLSPGVTVEGPALSGPIPARGRATLTTRVDASGWTGQQSRNVRLGTDDPDQGCYYLPTRMEVRPDLSVDRERAQFGDVAVYESPRQTFTFVRESGEPTRIRVASPLPAYLEADIDPAASATRLSFTFRPARVPPGARQGFERIAVETSAPLQPRFDLDLEWQLHHPIEASPSRVVFQDPGQRTLPVTLAAADGGTFRILGAVVEGEGFRIEGGRPNRGPEQTLVVHRLADGPARAVMVLTFADQESSLKVPLVHLPEGYRVPPATR